ncbi:MAG: hypothetical protein WCB31_07440 [Nitrososphaeraceae archaeon]
MVHLDDGICLKLLSHDAFKSGTLYDSFQEQKTDISVINLSHSEFGDLFVVLV